ncbi:hypothetical protein B6N60_02090 [Richelia sinica FACHB-800]|uniref:Uncharacterized protein n=1 Tax=Richelia sinica FACHB-800 TaxID=1357546 RepID=A0A975Y4P8_9NOST|nr:hypothetical protein B6N60_02090 [Richelia sinica FACHB-800]
MLKYHFLPVIMYLFGFVINKINNPIFICIKTILH